MSAELLQTLYGYNRWATERVFTAASGLLPEQLLAPAAGGQRSVRDTLVHLVDAQRGVRLPCSSYAQRSVKG